VPTPRQIQLASAFCRLRSEGGVEREVLLPADFAIGYTGALLGRGGRLTVVGVVAIAAGCGSGGGGAADGSPPGGDAASVLDGSPPDGALAEGTVTIHLEEFFVPESVLPIGLAPVLVFDRRGTLFSDTVTDADGNATALVQAGSTVVMLVPDLYTSRPTSVMVFGVEPGADIVLGGWDYPGAGAELGTMTFEIEPFAGATRYRFTACGSRETTGRRQSLQIFERCVRDGRVGVSVRALDDAGSVLAYLYDETAFVPDAEVTVEGAWAPPSLLTVSMEDFPPMARSVGVDNAWMLTGDVDHGQLGSGEVDIDGGAGAISLVAGPASFAADRLVWLVVRPVADVTSWQRQTHRVPATVAVVELDGGDLLPWYTSPIYSVESRTLAWTSTSGAQPDGLFGSLSWTGPGSDDSGTIHFVAPPDADSVVIPELPEEHAAHAPVVTETVRADIIAVDQNDWDGYRDALADGWPEDLEAFELDSPVVIRRSEARATF